MLHRLRPRPISALAAALLALTLLALSVRFIALDADSFAARYNNIHISDERIYNDNARNAVLFGDQRVQASEWRPFYYSPLYTVAMLGWYAALGVSDFSGRLLAAIFGIVLTVALAVSFSVIARRRYVAYVPSIFFTLLITLDFSLFFYARLALPEIGALSFIYISLFLQLRNVKTDPSTAVAVASAAFLGGAALFKLPAIFVVAALLASYSIVHLTTHPKRPGLVVLQVGIVGALVFGVYGMFYALNPEGFTDIVGAQPHHMPALRRLFTFGNGSRDLVAQNLGFYGLLVLAVASLWFRNRMEVLNQDPRRQLLLLALVMAVGSSALLEPILTRQIYWIPLGYLVAFSLLFPGDQRSDSRAPQRLSPLVGALLYSGTFMLLLTAVPEWRGVGYPQVLLAAAVFVTLLVVDRQRWRNILARVAFTVFIGMFLAQNLSVLYETYANVSHDYQRVVEGLDLLIHERSDELGREAIVATAGVPVELSHKAFFASPQYNKLDEYSRNFGIPDLIMSIEYAPGQYYHQEFIEENGFRMIYSEAFPWNFSGMEDAQIMLFEYPNP